MSKRDIQQRMYREAAQVYQQYLQQDISSLDGFDPIVQMLINGCADELSMLETEVRSAEIRMLKELAQLLTPDAYLGARPAHGVLYLPSIETIRRTDFLTDILSYTNPKGKKTYFTPAGNYNLLSGQVRYIASGTTLTQISHGVDTDVLLRSRSNHKLPQNTLWIGLELGEDSLNQKQISFYFDIPFEQNFRYVTELLVTSNWTIGDTPVRSSPGLYHIANKGETDWAKFHAIRNYEHNIRSHYQNRFLTIQCPEDKTLADFFPTSTPSELSQCFYSEELEQVISGSSILWFEVNFSDNHLNQTNTSEILQRLVVQVNCFPIINRRKHQTPFVLNNEFNLFALHIKNGNYYGIESVKTSDKKRVFVERPFSILSDPNFDTKANQELLVYAVRKEGVQRFDKRTALDWMENILRITREESLVYNALGKNILTSNVKNIQQSINDINAKLNNTRVEEDTPQKVFLAFPSITKKDNQTYVIATYWSTDGHEGQHIPNGEEFQIIESESRGLAGSVARLLTTTVGGRSPLLNKDHLAAFRSALVVRDKIVTEEDIRLYCFQELGSDLKAVHIKKGVAIGSAQRQGYVRTLMVELQLNTPVEEVYAIYLKNKLEVELNTKSACYLPIHIKIIDEN